MKLLLLAFFIAVGACAPLEPSGEPVEVIVHGLSDGEPLEVGHIVDVKVKEIVEGQLAAVSNPLHPFTAQGLAEIAQAEAIAAAEEEAVAAAPAPITPELPQVPELPGPVVLPEPAVPDVQPAPVILPEPSEPAATLPEPVVLPAPEVPEIAPEPIVLPEPAVPEVVAPQPAVPEVVEPQPAVPEVVEPEPAVPEAVEAAPAALPAPAPQLTGEVYNDGTVTVAVNGPEDPGVYATLQSWVNVLLNYVNSGVQYTQQLI